jgi:hypothetical protein
MVVPIEDDALGGLQDLSKILGLIEQIDRRLARTETRLCKLMGAMGVDPSPDDGYGR